jgi:hypothetical protein
MMPVDILDLQEHKNSKGSPYTVAIVDDPNDGKTKLVITFAGHGDFAVLLLDKLIEEENIDEDVNSNAAELAKVVRGAAAAPL